MKLAIVLLKPWGTHPQGARLELDKPIADLLVGRKAAELQKPKTKKKHE